LLGERSRMLPLRRQQNISSQQNIEELHNKNERQDNRIKWQETDVINNNNQIIIKQTNSAILLELFLATNVVSKALPLVN
jgi:hypothetical protein